MAQTVAGAVASGGLLAYYRLYMLGSAEGRFIGFEEFDAVDDVEAVKLAEPHVGARPLELWCGKRKVKSFPASGEPGGS